MQNIDSCIAKLKDFYLKSDDKDKASIVKIMHKIINVGEDIGIDEIALSIDGIDKVTSLPNREALICDISMLKDDAMLIFLHINQIAALKQLYGVDVARKIIIDKSLNLQRIASNKEAKVYNINIQKFAILVNEKSLFDKYFTLLKYSILDNIDNNTYEINEEKSIITDFTAGISYGKEHLFHYANVALQEALLSKRNYKTYETCDLSRELKQSSLDKLNVYKSALHEGDIVPYFQPIVDAKTHKILKYEALARLETKDGKVISPYDFLNSAIEDKTFEYFTRQMMQKVFNVFSETHADVSINVTYENINSVTMMSYIKNRLEKYGGEGITFEIVETEEIKNYDIVEEFILLVKKYGAKVSIDDFGSGYSNFTNIIKLNIDFIKIDGTLITKLHDDEKVKKMVQGLIQFAQSIDVKTIAEFVSSKEIADEVTTLGVDYLQGYYHGEPKPAHDYMLV